MALITVISGAGISAESGLKTFRDDDGLWRNHSFYELATPEAWRANPQLVLDFYNERRAGLSKVQPNPAHVALAELEASYDVIIVTQNVDDLHERAGSSNVIHLHGELSKNRSSKDFYLVYESNQTPIELGDTCALGSQLRPHIVWFGEEVMHFNEAIDAVAAADIVLVVGTSLSVYPAASLLGYANSESEKVLVTKAAENPPAEFSWLKGNAGEEVPKLVEGWLQLSRIGSGKSA